MPSHRSIVIFSGGTAANYLVDIFESIRKSKDCPISYVIPISDNGGSSSELIRVFGGPGIGDVRSRLIRLIPRLPPSSPGFKEREGIRAIFNHRLGSTDARAAKMQWADIVDGTSHLWKDISSAKKELIRSFFNLVNAEITKRSRPPSSTFDFTSASVGNLFLTGARLFSGSFESAIYLLGSVCGIDDEGVKVIPSINSNFSHHIAAGLEDGTVIVGQNAISHPSPDAGVSALGPTASKAVNGRSGVETGILLRRPSGFDHYHGDEHDTDIQQQEEEDAHLPGTLPTLRTKNITFNKDAHLNEELPARISRIWYINPYGQEILPPANPRAIQALNNAQAVIYSIGSLYTSLVPSLVLRGIGDALRRNTSAGGSAIRTKILILNGCLDREVGPQPPHEGAQGSTFSAIDFVEAIVRAGEQSRGAAWESEASGVDTSGINTPEGCHSNTAFTGTEQQSSTRSPTKSRPGIMSSKSEGILRTSLRHRQNQSQNLNLYPPPLLASAVNSTVPSRDGSPTPSDPDNSLPSSTSTAPRSNSTIDALSSLASTSASRPSTPHAHSKSPTIYNHYITHLIHLPNSPHTPHVDRDLLLSRCGIQCIKIYGRTAPDGQGMRYDPAALRGAIEAILGRRAEREVDVGGGKRAATVEAGIAVGRMGQVGGREEGLGAAGANASAGAEVGVEAEGEREEWNWREKVKKGREMYRRNTLDG